MKTMGALRMASYFLAAVVACETLAHFGPLAGKSPLEQEIAPAVFVSAFSTGLLLFGGRGRKARRNR